MLATAGKFSIVIEKWYNRRLRLLNMLFPGRIYIARGPWHLRDFCNIFLPNISENQKKVLLSDRGALALCHTANTALVIALSS